MSWLVFAFLSGLGISIATLIEKKVLQREHALEFSATYAFSNAVFSIPLVLFADFSNIRTVPLLIVFFATIAGAFAFLFVAKATRHMEVSAVSPLLILTPGVTAILAFAWLDEPLTPMQIAGMLLLLVGSYVLETRPHDGLMEPIRRFIGSHYMHLMVLAIFFFSIGSLTDRYVLTNFDIDPIAYLFFAQIFMAFHFLVISWITHDGIREVYRGLREGGMWVVAASIITVLSRVALMKATVLAYIGLVIGIKRMSSLLTTMIGGELYHEHNIMRKSLACIIMLAGAYLIAS